MVDLRRKGWVETAETRARREHCSSGLLVFALDRSASGWIATISGRDDDLLLFVDN